MSKIYVLIGAGSFLAAILAIGIVGAGFVVEHTAPGLVNTQTTAADADTDADSVQDGLDNCFSSPNPGQENGDGDAHGDVCDNCPAAPNPAQTDTDGDLAGDACDAPGSGNVDCSSAVNAVDALKVLRHTAALPVTQSEPCVDIGAGLLTSGWKQGDVNCSGVVNAVDALLILRVVAGLPANIPQGCPQIKPP